MDGVTHELPLPAVGPLQRPSQQELEYLVGFFDGDGCISMVKSTGQVLLTITQSVDSVDVLLHFRSLLGGGVSRRSASTGTKKATLLWCVYGSKMKHAAAALSKAPFMKQAELWIARQGNVAEHDRAVLSEELRRLKQPDYVPHQLPQCSWPYFAGLFDAEGSISIDCRSTSCLLALGQSNPFILAQLLKFLRKRRLQSVSVYQYKNVSVLSCSNFTEAKRTLKLLLANGLRVKAKQAELVLNLTTDNHLETRGGIVSLNGLQNRYKRLDGQGIARAKDIHRIQQQIQYRRKSFGEQHDAVQRELDELRERHKLKSLISQCSLLRKDIRKALREGGFYTFEAMPKTRKPRSQASLRAEH